ncbi:MAG: molybdate ABC transporter substrate-binding protein [Bacteroidia bacterium]
MKKFLKSISFATLFFIVTTSFVTEKKITLVVAANLKTAMDSIITCYKIDNPDEIIQVTYGASGKFYEQISNDAPFDIFFSADMNYPNKLKEKKIAISPVKLYAIGKLVLWSKRMDPNTQEMNTLLDASIKKISIANPTTAPYGAKAIEAVKYFKIYEKVKSKLVYGENISQTAQFVAFGAADIGFIALSDALSPAMKKEAGKYYVIPENSYSPLEQGCAVLKHGKGNSIATKFYDYISSEKAIHILTYYGYAQKQNK